MSGDITVNLAGNNEYAHLVDYFTDGIKLSHQQRINPLANVGIREEPVAGKELRLPADFGQNTAKKKSIRSDRSFNPQGTDEEDIGITWDMWDLDLALNQGEMAEAQSPRLQIDKFIDRIEAARARLQWQIIYNAVLAVSTDKTNMKRGILGTVPANVKADATVGSVAQIQSGAPVGWNADKLTIVNTALNSWHVQRMQPPVAITSFAAVHGFVVDKKTVNADYEKAFNAMDANMDMYGQTTSGYGGLRWARVGEFATDTINEEADKINGMDTETVQFNGDNYTVENSYIIPPDDVVCVYPTGEDSLGGRDGRTEIYWSPDNKQLRFRWTMAKGAGVWRTKGIIRVKNYADASVLLV